MKRPATLDDLMLCMSPEIRAYISALEKDAARYRFLCDRRLGWFDRLSPLPWGTQSKKDALDAAIDVALATEKPR